MEFGGVAWLGDELIVARRAKAVAGDLSPDFEIEVVDPASGRLQKVDTDPPDAECGRTDQYSPVVIPGGRAAWIWRCFTMGPIRGLYRVLVLAPNETRPQTLAEFRSRETVHSITVGPGQRPRMLAAIGSRICETVAELVADAPVRLDIDIQGPGGVFNLADPRVTTDCRDVGFASHPAVSFDGDVALLASTEAIGQEGPSRGLLAQDLYTLDSFQGPAHRHDVSVLDVRGMAWSASERVLVLSGRVLDQPGTWLYDPHARALTRISDAVLAGPAWSFDRTYIAGQVGDPDAGVAELVILRHPTE